MFRSFHNSWQFAMMSYRIIWNNKGLLVFPIFSTVAAGAVLISFLIPLFATGMISEFNNVANPDQETNPVMWAVLFAFYFVNYFVIVFFNTALIACVMKILSGEEADAFYGLNFAFRRLPQILGWAFFSALVGVTLAMIEKSHKKAGAIIAALLGSAWTALTYFVVPVIVVEGCGPIEAFKRSASTLKDAWGEALVGNFSLGLIGTLITIPIIAIFFVLLIFGLPNVPESMRGVFLFSLIGLAIMAVVIMAAVTTAADTIFKAVLYSYATGKTLPDDINEIEFGEAFAYKG